MSSPRAPVARRHGSAGRARRGSFTLVELLVVVAIIALLTSIMMPALRSVWRSVDRSHCQSNLRQIGNGLCNYAITFARFLPPCERYAFDVWNSGAGWVGLGHLVGHGGFTEGDGKLFYCPSYKSSDWDPSMPGYAAIYVGHGMYSYSWGNTMFGWHRVKQGTRTIMSYQYRASGFDHPVSEGGHGRLMKLTDGAGCPVVADQLDWRFGPDFCHKVGLHVLFLDGHAAWFHDTARYIQTAGYPWSADDAGPKYEVFWKLFEKLPSGSVEVAELANR